MELSHPIMVLVAVVDQVSGTDENGEPGLLSAFAHDHPHILYSWLVMLFLIVVGRLATSKITMVPQGFQNVLEWFMETLANFQESVMGHAGRVFFPLMATLIMYVACCNLLGIIPGGYSPTANINTTAGLAIIIFLLTHVVGFSKSGFSYLKHFMGPIPLLAPVMFVIEIVSNFSRLISLSLRLFGNVMGEELVVTILFVLAGAYFIPLPMLFLGLLMGSLQAFIITLLAMVYINEAMADGH